MKTTKTEILALLLVVSSPCFFGCSSEEGSVRPIRVFVVNTGSNSISVIDHEQQAVVETIELGAQPHGQAPSSKGDRIYVTTDGGNGEVIAIDTSDNSILWRIDAGDELNQPDLTRDDRFLFAPDLLAGRVVVVDVDLGEVVDEIEMKDPEDGSTLITLHNTYASLDGDSMYVTAIFSEKIAKIDVDTREITRIYKLMGQPRPAALTDDESTMYVQLSSLHGFIALNLETGEEDARIEWPDSGNRPPGFDGEPILTKSHGIGLTPDNTEVWANTSIEGQVRVYSVPELQEQAVIKIGNIPNWMAFTPDGKTVYITNQDPEAPNGTVSVIDVESREVLTTIDVGKAPKRIHLLELPEE